MVYKQRAPKSLAELEIADPVQRDAVRLITRIVKETGFSPTQIARQSGLSPSTITRMYPVPSVTYALTTRSLDKIKRAFPKFEVDGVANQPTMSLVSVDSAASSNQISVYAFGDECGEIYAPDFLDDPEFSEDLANLEAWSGLRADPISQTKWLQDELNNNRFFGIFVAGDNMQPRLCPGEIAIVDSIRPAGANADALITLVLDQGEEMIFFAHIIERRGASISLSFHADVKKKPIRIPRSLIVKMLPVVGILTGGR